MRFLSIIFFLLVLPAVVLSQDYPKYNFFAGYSYLRTDSDTINASAFGGKPGQSLRRTDGNLNGFDGSFTYYISEYVGLTANATGHFGDVEYRYQTKAGAFSAPVTTRQYGFLFGPEISTEPSRLRLFGRALFGFSRMEREAHVNGNFIEDDENAFAASFGGGVDVKVASKISLRPIQVSYVLTRFDKARVGSDTQHNLQYSGGIVFHP